jgi:hypothetical protein
MVKKEEQPYHEDDDEGKIFWEQTTTKPKNQNQFCLSRTGIDHGL